MKITTLTIAVSLAALTLTGCPAPKKTGAAPSASAATTPAASAPAATTPAATPAKTGE